MTYNFKIKAVYLKVIEIEIKVMTEAIWSEAVLEKLTTLTRASKFNFDAVAAEMGAYCSSVGSDIPIGSITAQECRRQFSASYLGVSEPAACDARKPNNKAVEEFLGTDFTFDEAMAFVDQLQHDSLNRQEEVFKRVLNALDAGGSDRKSADDISSHQEVGADVLSAWRARKQRDEESRVKKEKERVQREEEAVLEAQRVRLARRYETNSEDAQGINPLEHLDNPESGLVAGLESKMVLQNGDPIFSVPETDQDAYLTQHFKMTDFVNSDEFSAILDSLERDLDAQAEAKSRRRKEGVGGAMGEEEEEEEAGESELGEILKYLDSCDNLPTAARGATADEVIADPTDINEVFMQNALSNMQNISNMQTAISANVAAKRAVVGSAEQAVSDSADKKTVSALQLPVPAGVASVAVAPPQPPAPSAAPSSTQPRRVIETILDDSDSDEDDVAAQQRKWRESRNKLKSGAEAAKVEAGGVSAVASAPAQVWGGGGASTKNTAAGLQQRQVVSKCKSLIALCCAVFALFAVRCC